MEYENVPINCLKRRNWKISKDLLEMKAELKEEALVISKVDSGDTAPSLHDLRLTAHRKVH